MELSDAALLDELKDYMRDRRIFIADGHHRYETSLLCRDERRAAAGAAGDGEEPWDFISMAFIGLNDPGLVLLPVHRLLKCEALAPRDLAAALEPFCEIRKVDGQGRDARIREACRQVLANTAPAPFFGLITPEEVYLLSPLSLEEALSKLELEHPRNGPSWTSPSCTRSSSSATWAWAKPGVDALLARSGTPWISMK